MKNPCTFQDSAFNDNSELYSNFKSVMTQQLSPALLNLNNKEVWESLVPIKHDYNQI